MEQESLTLFYLCMYFVWILPILPQWFALTFLFVLFWSGLYISDSLIMKRSRSLKGNHCFDNWLFYCTIFKITLYLKTYRETKKQWSQAGMKRANLKFVFPLLDGNSLNRDFISRWWRAFSWYQTKELNCSVQYVLCYQCNCSVLNKLLTN